MYIKLVNFRCYENKIFEFDDIGLFLISAPSGSGKSTILMAVNFALYGSGSKITTYGKKSCSVEFNFDGIKICRTKCPNSLKVNDIYIDDVAQKIINEKFGNTFNVTGYLSQNGLNSFIIMSPTDKLQFLEDFSFKDCNLAEIKNRCKSLINKRHEEHNKTITQLEMSSKMLEDINKPQDIVKFPLPIKKNSNLSLIIKNEEIRYKNCETNIKKYNHLLSKLKCEINELKVLNTYIQSKHENILHIDSQLLETVNEENNINLNYMGDDHLDKNKFRLNRLLSLKQLRNLEVIVSNDKEKLNKMKEKELEEIKKDLEEISLIIWKSI
jgi:DNA repair exonuclease SbcCD ATPase subunit